VISFGASKTLNEIHFNRFKKEMQDLDDVAWEFWKRRILALL